MSKYLSSPLVTSTSTSSILGYDVTNCDTGCPDTKYTYYNESCLSACSSPYIASTAGSIMTCSLPCGSNYLYPNSSCQTTCASPMISSTQSDVKYCKKPCSSGKVLYSNGTCGSSCASPMVPTTDSNGVITCKNPCSSSQPYLYPNRTCLSSCNTPYTSTTQNDVQTCWPICSSSQYLYSDSSCQSTCSSPFINKIVDGQKTCESSCSSSRFAYPDSSCQASCSSPLTSTQQSGVNYRKSSCTNPSQSYLYWNSTCGSVCSPPLVSSSVGGINRCSYPCVGNDSLYWDGSCSVCNSPLTFDNSTGNNFCRYSCNSSDYLYENGACASYCTSPMISAQEKGAQLCNGPCADRSQVYYPDKGTCENTCGAPYVRQVYGLSAICYKPVTQSQVAQLLGAADFLGFGQQAAGMALIVACAVNPADPAAVTFGAVAKMISYIRYMNIAYPSHLMNMFKSTNSFFKFLSIGPDISTKTKDKMRYHSVPDDFQTYGVYASFLVNYWSTFTFVCLIFGSAVLAYLLERLAQELRHKYFPSSFIRKIQIILQNFTITQIYESSIDIVIFFVLDITRNEFSTTLNDVSFILSGVFIST